jgi:hypothetical protein
MAAYSRRLLKGCRVVEHLGSDCASATSSTSRSHAGEGIVVKMLSMHSRVKTQHAHTTYKINVAKIINTSKIDIPSFLDLAPTMAAIAIK